MTSTLEHYLAHYADQTKPDYAVLVTGPWGSRKTFQVVQCLRDDQYWYVSLFGRTSPAEIHDAVLAEIYPTLSKASSVLRRLDNVAKAATNVDRLGTSASGILRATLQRKIVPSRILIFDDLERCQLRTEDLLGSINHYIEHHHFRVIMICDQTKVPEQFLEMKEKLIGHTIPVEPQIDSAFSAFVQQINNSRSASILTQCRKEVIQTFLASNEKSLRVLRHACRDLSRLLEILTPEHLANEDAVNELIPLFTALDIGIRTNSIDERDMKSRSTTRMMDDYLGAKDGESTRTVSSITLFERQYSNVNFRTDLFNDYLLIEMLISGIYDEANIHKSFAQSSHFFKPEQQAPWKIVIKFDLLEDSIVEKALEDMQQQIAGEETLEPGEILHIFSLLLLMSFNGTCQQSFSDVVTQAKSYIDTLSISGNLSLTANSDVTIRGRPPVRIVGVLSG